MEEVSATVFETESDYSKPKSERLDALVDDLRQRVKGSKFPSQLIPRLDSPFLSIFIRTKNYDIDAAFLALEHLFQNISRNIDYIHPSSRPSQVASAFSSETMMFLQSRIRGCRVAILRLRNWDPKKVSMRDLQLVAIFLSERAIREVETQTNGIIIVVDLTAFTFEQLWKLNVKELRIIIGNIQDGLPMRITEVHFLNPPRFFWSAYKIIMLFLKEKIRKRVKLHYGLESIKQHLDADKLPQCLGGDLQDSEAFEYKWTDDLLQRDLPYEEFWSGRYGMQT